jgi:hypothetical protein
MRAFSQLAEVRPMLLVEARAAVQMRHPNFATLEVVAAPEVFDALRTRVHAATRAGEEALRALAAALGPREVRRLITGLREWEELRGAVVFLLRERARASLLGPLWQVWETVPTAVEVREALLEFGGRYGWDGAVASPYTAHAERWVGASNPGESIRGWLDAQGLSASDLPRLAGTPLRADTPLHRLVREAVLTDGSVSQYRTEGSPALNRWRSELSPQKAVRFGQNYLVHLPINEWYRPILNWIEATYGLPRRPRLASFWEPVPESVRKAFQAIFIRERIADIFRGDEARREYWLRWTNALADVVRGEVRGVEYGILDFGNFGVVEFFQYGHAAFFYPPQMLERLRQRRVSDPADLRHRWYPQFLPWTNRLIHRQGWQYRADEMVRAWMKHM